MQCVSAALAAQAPACSACTLQRQQQQRFNRSLTASQTHVTRQAARQQLAAPRHAAARSGKQRCLAVAASANYGAEWSTPKDAYLTVVRGT